MRLGATKSEPRSQATNYRSVARALVETARAIDALGEATYGNGLAIIAIHTAIAYTDALTIAHRELKSTDGDHVRAADVLVFALGARAEASHVKRLRRVLAAKSKAAYSGNYYTLDEGRDLLWHVEKYAAWAEEMLGTP
ncbi:MAG TPA: hypothetical protein VGO40_01755 [Longimicrobium sp.]|jgi:hypothetical protein|nr:hypothetical protein [Longimicrobium sp.]